MNASALQSFDQQQPGEATSVAANAPGGAERSEAQGTSCGHAGSGVHPEPVSFQRGTGLAELAPPDNVVDLGLGDPFGAREWRAEEADRRLKIIETFESLIAQGHSKATAAKEVGQGYATVWRWQRAYEQKGYAGLFPSTDRCGRKSEVEKLRDRGIDVDAILAKVKGINLDTESTTAALRLYASSDDCPEDLARLILDPNRCSKHALPPSLRKAVAVTQNERKLHRGPRQLALGGIYTPRKLDILPGDIFTADDTTPIWAWWVPWIECEEYHKAGSRSSPLQAYRKFGCRCSRGICCCLMGTSITTVSGTAYFVYLGLLTALAQPKFVEFFVTAPGIGGQTAEVGFFSSPAAPNKANQSLTKLVSTGGVDALTSTGVKRNTSAFATDIAAGTHLWAGIRIAMATTQPTISGLCADFSQGRILSTPAAGVLTGAGPFAGVIIGQGSYVNTALVPDVRATLD